MLAGVPKTAARNVETARFCKFSGVQLHGDEDANYIAQLRKQLAGVKIVKASTVKNLESAGEVKPDAWLIDSSHGPERGRAAPSSA